MIWATSTNGHSAESTLARPPGPVVTGVLSDAVPLALWRDDSSWDGSSIIVVEPQGMRAVGTAAAVRGYLWVPITAPRPAQRGRLALHIEECIEAALEQRGAPPPGVGASTDLDASLSDQLYRARFVEMRGIAVGIPSLEGIANLGRVLDAEDSAVLRWWLAATTERPICVVLSSENRNLRVYPSPVPFGALMDGVAAPSPRPPSAETAASVVAMELSELPPSVGESETLEDCFTLGDDVDLPELDRALGLTPDPVATDSLRADAPGADSERSAIDVVALQVEAAPVAEAEVETAQVDSAEVAAAIGAPAVSEVAPARDEAAAVIVQASIEAVSVAAPSVDSPAVSTEPAAAPESNVVTAEPRSAAAEAAAAPAPAATPAGHTSAPSEPAAPLPVKAAVAAPLPVKTLMSPRLLARQSSLVSSAPSAASSFSAAAAPNVSVAPSAVPSAAATLGVPVTASADVANVPAAPRTTELRLEAHGELGLPAMVLEDDIDDAPEADLEGDETTNDTLVAEPAAGETSDDAIAAAPAEAESVSTNSESAAAFSEPAATPSESLEPSEPVAAPSEPSVVPLIAASAMRAPLARKRVPFIVPADDDGDDGEPLVGNVPEAVTPTARPEPTVTPEQQAAPRSASMSTPAERPEFKRSALKPLRPRPVAPSAPLAAEASAPSESAAAATEGPATSSEAPIQEAKRDVPARPASAEPDPFEMFARDNWRTWVQELDAARGPKPLAVIERLFVTCYMRLDAAVQRGIADASARETMSAWRDSFAKSYTEAFDALRVRGKRPTMVLDIPDLAQRIGRLHGARRVQLMLVDGLRFDLGMMVQDRLKAAGDATLTERLLLWSALPTNTTTQVELIGRGPDGLKDKDTPAESPAVVARGRAAHAPRRIRTGRRELFKLVIVVASLREGEGSVRERLVGIADDVSVALTDHFTKQPPRTLVMVFGDHGFRIDDSADNAVQVVSQGGATPEEVLVPAFAWLTGAPH